MAIRSVAVVGPTASGKTQRAVAIARLLDGEIISADSRQVYRGMSIGTGKDLSDYGDIPYHLIDIADAGEKYNLHRFLKDFHVAYNDLQSRGKVPVICGGSGMYVENALKGIRLPEVPENKELRSALESMTLDELALILSGYKQLHNKTDIDTTKRAIRAIEIHEYYRQHPEEADKADAAKAQPLDCTVIGVDIDRNLRRERISKRLRDRLDEGMVQEIRYLIEAGVAPEDLMYYGLEYKFVTMYVTGRIGYDTMVKDLETAIHQFAKRQMTWFRGMETRGIKINWLPFDLPVEDFAREALRIMRGSVS